MSLVNESSNSSAESFDSTGDDLLVISIWSTILVYALITNTLTVIGIARSRSMRSSASYWIVISLAVCDLFMIAISVIHIVPATYLHESYVEIQHARTIWAMFLYNVFWYTGVIQLAAMAVNRFVSIVFPLHYKRVFSPKNTLLIIGLLYLCGLLSSLPSLHNCCYVIYDYNIYVTYYMPADSDYMWLDIFLNTFSVLTMILCYAAILIRVRKSTLTRRKHQMVAVVAKARKNSHVALLMTAPASTGPSGTTSSSAMSNVPNGTLQKSPQTKRLLKQHFNTAILSSSSSLTTLNKNNNNEFTMQCKKISISRTSSAEPVLARPKSQSQLKKREFRNEEDAGACKQLLTPQQKQKRPQQTPNSRRNHQSNPQQASRREMRLFIQFFVVSLVFLSTWVTWQWLPRLSGASKWIYFATTTFFFINNAVNPTVYLIFNSGLRHQVKILFCPKRAKQRHSSKAAQGAAGHMNGGQAGHKRTNSSSSGSNPQLAKSPGYLGRRKDDEHSMDDEQSELKSASNLALPNSRDRMNSVKV